MAATNLPGRDPLRELSRASLSDVNGGGVYRIHDINNNLMETITLNNRTPTEEAAYIARQIEGHYPGAYSVQVP
jgi:hypothetical protein